MFPPSLPKHTGCLFLSVLTLAVVLAAAQATDAVMWGSSGSNTVSPSVNPSPASNEALPSAGDVTGGEAKPSPTPFVLQDIALLPPVDGYMTATNALDVLPVSPKEGALLLNGDWKFKYIPSLSACADEDFFKPGFDVSGWGTMPVPAHWELHGAAEPQYASEVKPGLGLYRTTFHVPGDWKGKRVYIRLDGVLYGYTAYVNGKEVGRWASSYNPATFDITDALDPGNAGNVLAIRVSTRSRGWDFDTMDCWGLSGIFRDVTLFALPRLHFKDYEASTTLRCDGSAEVSLNVVAAGPGSVKGRVVAPDGKTAKDFRIELDRQGRGSAKLVIADPRIWSAETPALYGLEMDLLAGAKAVQRFHDRIGLRQVSIEDGILKLNGRPLKLRGADHHEIWPREGRVPGDDLARRDLELMRDANINFIRTSHYPPDRRFLALCDEMGFYVDCEVPFIHGRKNLMDPSYQPDLLDRARATWMRDKNHPSIILWSIGNENPITANGLNVGKFMKQLDPTRPITYPTVGSYFRNFYQFYPEFVDLYSPHYPATDKVRKYGQTLTKPIVVTEYAHQRGISSGGEGVQDIWEAMYAEPRVAGGAVWLFQDQGIARTATDMKSVPNWDQMVWVDEHTYHDTHGYFGVDGIVYSDRTPQTDYWQLRKVYSPIQIQEPKFTVGSGQQTLSLKVENRHDFSSLKGYTLDWSLLRNNASVAAGTLPLRAEARASETVALPVTLPDSFADDVNVLDLKCKDPSGRILFERSIRLQPSGRSSLGSKLAASLQRSAPRLQVTDTAVTVTHPGYRLVVYRTNAACSLTDASGAPLVNEFGPHAGRPPLISESGKKRDGDKRLWQGELLDEPTGPEVSASETPEGILVTVKGSYARPGAPTESLDGGYRLLCRPDGIIRLDYGYTPVAATGAFTETGFSLRVPASLPEFRWLGKGPYSSYPGKDRLAEYGLFHLNRDDLYFPGHRRETEIALLTAANGTGILMEGADMTVSVNRRDDATLLSHLNMVSSQKNPKDIKKENVENKSETDASSLGSISGSFDLLPLGTAWPAPLSRWFGSPGKTAPILHKAFPHSYDE